ASPVERLEQAETLVEMHAGALRLERHERLPLDGDAIERAHAEALELVLRQIDAAECTIFVDVAHDVDQLERDPERHRTFDIVRAVDGDTRDADCTSDLLAIAAQVIEGRVPRLLEILQSTV